MSRPPLRASADLFRQLIDQSDTVFWVRTLDPPQLLYVSPAAERVWGRSVEELLGSPTAFADSLHPGDRDRVLAARPGPAGTCETQYRLIHPDGSVRWILTRAFGLGDAADRPLAGISLDITDLKAAEDQLRLQKTHFADQLAVARATMRHPELGQTLQNTLEVMRSLTGAEGGALFLVDETGEPIDRFVTRHPLPPDERSQARPLLKRGLAGWVLQHREPALVLDTSEDRRWLTLDVQRQDIRSALCVPISMGDSLLGVLTLTHSSPRHFGERHVGFLTIAAEQIALALRNAQMFDTLTRFGERQSTLYAVLRAACSVLDEDEALKLAIDAIVRHTGWSDMAVCTPSPAGGGWTIKVSTDHLAHRGPLPLTGGVVGRTLATGRTQLVPDVDRDPDYRAAVGSTRSELAVPLRHRDRVLGVLNLESEKLDAFGEEEVRLAESLADAVSIVLENAGLFSAVTAEGERLGSVVSASRDGVLLVGTDAAAQVVNRPALRLLGLRGSVEEWTARPLAAIVERLRETGRPGAAEVLSQLAAHERVADAPAEGELEEGGLVVRWRHQPLASTAAPLGRLVVLRDVTEERQLERLREDLTHTLVHDLRGPMTTITGTLDLLEHGQDQLSATSRQMLGLASRANHRLLSLVDTILEVARLEQGAVPLKPEPAVPATLVRETIDACSAQALAKGLRFITDVPTDLPPLQVDTQLALRVLQNLVGNAVKFARPQGEVRVAIAPAEGAPGWLLLKVSDTGPPIPADVQARLFQKFAAGNQRERGHGLGLAFCKLAVEAHGGRIWAESAPDGVVSFSFTLPASASDPSGRETPHAEPAALVTERSKSS